MSKGCGAPSRNQPKELACFLLWKCLSNQIIIGEKGNRTFPCNTCFLAFAFILTLGQRGMLYPELLR